MLDQIRSKILKKGWNVYLSTEADTYIDTIVPRGPCKKLEIGNSYVIYESTKNPSDVEQVRTTLHSLAWFPTINYHGRNIVFAEFKVHGDFIEVEMPVSNSRIPYQDLLQALDTLTFAHPN